MKQILLITVLLISSLSHAQNSGALLGFLRIDKEANKGFYETYWITSKNNVIAISGPINDFLIPAGKDFYRVGTKEGCVLAMNMDTSKALYAVPYQEQPVVPLQSCEDAKKNLELSLKKKPLTEDEQCLTCDPEIPHSEENLGIDLVTTRAILYWESSYYDGGVHPDQGFDYKIKSIGKKPSYFEGIKGDDFLDDAKAIKPVDAEQKECLESSGQYDRIQWGVKREKFKWVFDGVLPTHRLCGYRTDFKIKKKIETPEVGPILPEKIKAQLTGKDDAFISPDGSLVIATDGQGFEVYAVIEGKLKSVLKKAAKVNRLRMQEWAQGEYVEKWDKVFAELVKNKWKDPKYEKYNPKKHLGR